MTRSLIETYSYLNIFIKEKDSSLIEDWFFCSMNKHLNQNDKKEEILKNWCEVKNIDYEQKKSYLSTGNENKWLKDKIKKGKKDQVRYKDILEYTGIPYLYEDFKETSSFVHAQDVISKIMPFTFYESIMPKLYRTIDYILNTVKLFPLDKKLLKEAESLEQELLDLVSEYCNIEYVVN